MLAFDGVDLVVSGGVPIGEEHGFCGFVVVDRGWWLVADRWWVLPWIGC